MTVEKKKKKKQHRVRAARKSYSSNLSFQEIQARKQNDLLLVIVDKRADLPQYTKC